jgi:L-lactate dehydrogenase complex protein LldG
MNSRDKILSAVRANQPDPSELPPLPQTGQTFPTDLTPVFISVLESIGGAAFIVSGFTRIATIVREQFSDAHRIVSGCPQLSTFEAARPGEDPHALENVDLAILPAHFGVAENGACWITESQMIERALPFITQHLALVIRRQDIVANMHEAYDRIGFLDAAPDAVPYGFATFIAGPSKTADIEQSLVLGAHGPASLTVFLIDEALSDAGFY